MYTGQPILGGKMTLSITHMTPTKAGERDGRNKRLTYSGHSNKVDTGHSNQVKSGHIKQVDSGHSYQADSSHNK